MALAIGILLLVLGTVAFFAWLPATFYFLQGFVAFSLLFWGLLAFLMGFSERKAKSEFERAVRDEAETVDASADGE